MPSLLDAIRARQLADQPPAVPEPLVVTRAEWQRFIETGDCPWAFVEPHVYRNVETGEMLDDRLRQIVLPGQD